LAKKAKYPQCRGKGLKCYEREISKAITRAKSCQQVKKNDRQGRFLISLGRFGKLPFGVTGEKRGEAPTQTSMWEATANMP
jgi:hypothetical protein